MKKIIFNSDDFTSVTKIENLRVISPSSHNQKLFIRLTENEVQSKIDMIVSSKRYPLLLEKLIEFKMRFSNKYFENNSLELNDFFVVLRRICRLLKQRFHLEVIVRMMTYSISRLNCKFWSNAFHEFTVATFHESVCEDFWKTKVFETLVVVRNLLQDIYDGVKLDDLTEGNLKKSYLVAYCLSQNNEEDSDKVFEDFVAFCKK